MGASADRGEVRWLRQVVRRGKQESIRVRRAMTVMASAAETPVPAIARLVAAAAAHPDRLPATYRRTRGIRCFHGGYRLSEDRLWDSVRCRKGADHRLWDSVRCREGADHSLAAPRPIRAARTALRST